MADIATRWSSTAGDFALALPEQLNWTDEAGNSIVDQLGRPVSAVFAAGDGLLAGDDLFTAAIISIFTDATAEADDVIADGSDDPRGWWGGPIGSKLWLRTRSKKLPTTLALAKADLEQALAWMLADGVAASIDVATEWGPRGQLHARILFRRSDGTVRALAFDRIWETI